MRVLLSSLTFLAFLVSVYATPAKADWTVGSGFGTDGTPFDTYEAFIIFDNGAGPFNGIGMQNISPATWNATTPNPNYTIATGPPIDGSGEGFSWDYHFLGNPQGNIVSIDTLAWTEGVGSELFFAASFDYINGNFANLEESFGGSYDFLQDPTGGDGYDRSGGAVPEPGSTSFLLFGLAMFGTARRRRTP